MGPGPAAYNYDINLIRPAAPKVTVKGRLDRGPTSVGPGPAGYNPKLDILYPTPKSALMYVCNKKGVVRKLLTKGPIC